MKCKLLSGGYAVPGRYYGHDFAIEGDYLVAEIDPALVPTEVAAGRVAVLEPVAAEADKPARGGKK